MGGKEREKLIVFSDLDGTLLDHHTYGFHGAQRALDCLSRHGVPVILTTSKTMAEVVRIRQQLNNVHPFIAENGALIAIPEKYCKGDRGKISTSLSPPFRIEQLGGDRGKIVEILANLRQIHGFRFIGFADMSVHELSRLTGLSPSDAALAGQRLSTEPILWQDGDEAWHRFSDCLADHQLQWVQGGRFISISAPFDKRTG